MDDTLAQLRDYSQNGTLIHNGIDWAGHCADRIEERDAEIAELRAALEAMVEEKADYMRLNLLGDPEAQHTIRWARAALAHTREDALTAPYEEPATMPDTRADHLAWCKRRALEYVERGDLISAVASMVSDLNKHPETAGKPDLSLLGLMMIGHGPGDVRKWIEGFN